ncbi:MULTISPECIES: Thivi_2564 family membrane protein [Ensifer]|uniref:Thivi_2564 family membrane protein n=1 Tax=unclassified Ensifer TaxID=2633371 RepID=UPI000B5B563E|nr:Thivi_2564 family membrane protein [Ensifer sp. OV372]
MFIAISILVTGLVITLMLWFVQKLPIDAAMKQMAHIVVVVVGVIALLHYLDLI